MKDKSEPWEEKIKLTKELLLSIGVFFLIVSCVIFSGRSEDGDKSYYLVWNGGLFATIGAMLLSITLASIKDASKHPKFSNTYRFDLKSVLYPLSYFIAFIAIVGLIVTAIGGFSAVNLSKDYKKVTFNYSFLSGISILIGLLASPVLSIFMAKWFLYRKYEYEKEEYDKKLSMARNYEYSMNYENAIKIYEELGLWEDAKRCRIAQSKTQQ